MKTLLPLFGFLFFISYIGSTAATQNVSPFCDSLFSCGECTQNNCDWCSLGSKCVQPGESCAVQLSQVKTDRLNASIFEQCDYGKLRATVPAHCSRIHFMASGAFEAQLSLRTGDFATLSYMLATTSVDGNQVHLPEDAYNITSIGIHFVENGENGYLIVWKSESMSGVTAFMILGYPSSKYQLGNALALKMVNSTELDCIYLNSRQITIATYYEMLFNTGTWVNVAVLVVSFSLLVLMTFVCSARCVEPAPKIESSKKKKKSSKKDAVVSQTSGVSQPQQAPGESTPTLPAQTPRHFVTIPKYTSNKLVNHLFAMLFAPTTTVVNSVGTASLIYFRYQAVIFGAMLIFAIIGCLILAPIYSSLDQLPYFTDISHTTFAMVISDWKAWSAYACLVAAVIFYLIAAGMMSLISLLSKTVAAPTKQPQKTTVMMWLGEASNHVPEHYLDYYFKSKFGVTEVQSVHLAYGEQSKPTGCCFVTFESAAGAAQCIEYYKKKKWYGQPTRQQQNGGNAYQQMPPPLNEQGWTATLAPEVGDIQWENLQYTVNQKKARKLVGFLLVISMIAPSYFAVMIGSSSSSIGRYAFQFVYVNDESFEAKLGVYVAGFLTYNLIPTLITSVTLLIMPIVKWSAAFAKHSTYSGQKKNVLTYMVFYMFFNTIFLPLIGELVVYQLSAQAAREVGLQGSVNYFNSVAIKIIMLILGQTFTSRAIPLITLMLSMMVDFIRNKNKAPKRQITRQPFYYEYNYALKLLVFTMVLIFGPIIPIVTLYGLLYMVITYIVDRFCILYVHSKEPVHSSSSFLDTIASSYALLVLVSCVPFLMIFLAPVLLHQVIYLTLGGLCVVIFVVALMVVACNWTLISRLKKLHPVMVVPEAQVTKDTYRSPYHPMKQQLTDVVLSTSTPTTPVEPSLISSSTEPTTPSDVSPTSLNNMV